jgi:hypothetical protein
MKTLIEIPRQIWGKVKDFATVKDISVNFAVEQLLTDGLIESGYILGKPEDGKERKLHEFEIGQAQNVTCEAADALRRQQAR